MGGWGVAYAAAKAAFHRVTDMCHVEFAAQGVWAFSIAPGLTLTESMRATGTDKVLWRPATSRRRPRSPARWLAWLGDEDDAGRYAGPDGLVPRALQGAGAGAGVAASSSPDGLRAVPSGWDRAAPRRRHLDRARRQRTVEIAARRQAQPGIGRLGQLVGLRLHLRVQGPSGIARAPSRMQGAHVPRGSAAAARHSSTLKPRFSRSTSAGIPLVPAASRCASTPREAPAHQHGHVPVTAVLTQCRRGLPGLAHAPRAEGGCDPGPQRPVGPAQVRPEPLGRRHGTPQQGQCRDDVGSRRVLHTSLRASAGGDGPHAAQRAGGHHLPAPGTALATIAGWKLKNAAATGPAPTRAEGRRRAPRSSRTRSPGARRRATRHGTVVRSK